MPAGVARAAEVLVGDVAGTHAVASVVAAVLRPGDLVLLTGDLGAGKTTFVQGLARALGVEELVTSPTFALLCSYPTAAGFELLHADLYRLERLSEVVDLGLAQLLEEDAVAVVEWGERGRAALPTEHLTVTLEAGAGGQERCLRLAAVGPGWLGRWSGILVALTAQGLHVASHAGAPDPGVADPPDPDGPVVADRAAS